MLRIVANFRDTMEFFTWIPVGKCVIRIIELSEAADCIVIANEAIYIQPTNGAL